MRIRALNRRKSLMKRVFRLFLCAVLLFSFVAEMVIYGVNEAKSQQTIVQGKASTNIKAELGEVSNVPTTIVQEESAIDVP